MLNMGGLKSYMFVAGMRHDTNIIGIQKDTYTLALCK